MGRLKYGDEAMNAIDNHIRPIGYKEFLLVPSIQQPVDAVPVIMCEYYNDRKHDTVFCDDGTHCRKGDTMDKLNNDYRIRKCGEGWEYCNGKCSECPKVHIVTTNHT